MKLAANATGFNAENALSLALAARVVYNEPQEVKKKLALAGYNRFRWFDERGTQAMVASDDENILLAFRGTEPTCLFDIMTDLDVNMVPGPFGRVHDGFNCAVKLLIYDIAFTINTFRNNNQALWITGHSLGGALAKLAAAWLSAEKVFFNGLYTFGSPRVGDQTFAEHFDVRFKTRTFRFVNHNDLVTRVPMRSMGFRHAGTHYYFNDKGSLLPDENSEWWSLFTDTVKNTFEDLARVALDSISDHSMDLYHKLLNEYHSKYMSKAG